MKIEVETSAVQTDQGWADQDGFVGPYRPGNGPRNDPRGQFPTGPKVGQPMPSVQCKKTNGEPFDLQTDRGDAPTLFMFFRSAVW